MTRLERTLSALDEANRLDPRRLQSGGTAHPREWIFAQRVHGWLERLDPQAADAVRLAARSHTLRRWEIPRNRYATDTAGYHAWRRATADHSAAEASKILRDCGYEEDLIVRVSELIRGARFAQDADARLLEDADCLAFLEIKLQDYLAQWDGEKLTRILEGTWEKMTPEAREWAMELPLPESARKIIMGFKEP